MVEGIGPTGSGGPPARREATILHVDMDAFFASVEVLDEPSLAGRPVIVGGPGGRGVVAACTYEARRYGVRSAMPSTVARRLCPDAVFLPGRFQRYQEVSGRLHELFDRVTPLVEGIGLDEAFLDVTGALRLLGDGPTIARDVRAQVQRELGLACSVGVARSKLIAKLASKQAKPRADRSGVRPGPGVVVVAPSEEEAFLGPLPLRSLWGIGPVTARKLESVGVRTVGDLSALPEDTTVRLLGRANGSHLSALARGHDERPVVPDREAKSIGHEETFPVDLWDVDELRRHLARMVDATTTHLRKAGLAARTVTVKVRFGDFTMVTRSHTLGLPIDAAPAAGLVASALLDSVDLARGVRLLGVSLSGFGDGGAGIQLSLSLDGPGPEGGEGATGGEVDGRTGRSDLDGAAEEAERLQRSWGEVTSAVDAIRERFGGAVVGPASLVGPDGIRVRRRGDAQWGPDPGNR